MASRSARCLEAGNVGRAALVVSLGRVRRSRAATLRETNQTLHNMM
jgi:hypothetical protein